MLLCECFVDRMNSHLQDAFDYLAPIRDNIQSTLTYKNQLKVISEQLPDDYKNDRYWGFVIANLLTNHYITDIAIQELFTGYTLNLRMLLIGLNVHLKVLDPVLKLEVIQLILRLS